MNHQRIASYLQKNRVLFLALVTVLIALFPVTGKAEEANLNFHVTPEFPDSQVEGSSSYFDLNLAPGTSENLSLTLRNASNQPIQVRITPHTAYTNVHGVVEYGKDAKEADPTLPYALDEVIESPEVIDLAGNETKTVDVALHMPQASFDGFLAGGLRISEVKEESEEEPTDEEGLAIKNEFAYVIGVVVSNSRDAVKPDLELLDVFADQLNHRNVISATIQNFTPTFVNRMAVEATIQRVGEDDILYEASEEMMQMAPNSHFHFPISLEGDRFVAGDYLLKMTATSGEEEWSWEREFTIETDEARSFNRADVTIDISTNWWMIGAISLLLLLVAVLLYLIIKRRKQATKQRM
ncbi:DUF916 and DUF3324 domain-containing protein [Enterococcus casseliflavus]|nr:DUF916 and DUF3324 domain-containing protein [Enterococcus casseliflavus]